MGEAKTKSSDPLATPDEPSLASLKRLLFGHEQDELAQVKERVAAAPVGPEELSDMLPAAITVSNSRDNKLARALSPVIGEALQSTIRKDPNSIVDAISPIMGPAIRESIRQAIRGMVQSLNKALDHSFSWKGLRWRWEAARTGKPFAEVVLLHTLVYRVAQVLLIHRETGLLIRHASREDGLTNADLTSSMLTAIQDFVRDSFGAGEQSLNAMTFGEQTVWIETGPRAILAALVDGEPPNHVRTVLRETLEEIHVLFAEPLAHFHGDDQPFAAADTRLSDCLLLATESDEQVDRKISEQESDNRKSWSLVSIAWGAVAVTAVVFLIGWGWQRRQERVADNLRRALAVPDSVNVRVENGVLHCTGRASHAWIADFHKFAPRMPGIDSVDTSQVVDRDAAWLEYVESIRNQSGVLVTHSSIEKGGYRIEGFRDARALNPDALLEAHHLDPNCVRSRWLPFPAPPAAVLQN